MRVLFIPAWHPTKNDPSSGLFIEKQAEAVASHGVETGLIYFQNLLLDGFFSEKMGLVEVEKNGVRQLVRLGVWPFSKPNSFFLNAWASLFDELFERWTARFGRPDLIHAEGLHAVFVAARLSEKHQIPFIFTEQSSAFRQQKIKTWLFPILKKCWQRAEKVLAVGPDLKNEMAKIWPDGARKIDVLPNLFDDRLFGAGLFCSKKKLPDEIVFLTVGSLEPKKAQGLLIDAFELFRRKNPAQKARLAIVGDGPLRSFLNEKAKKSSFSNEIELAGVQTGEVLRDRFLSADFFVLPSLHETFGVVAAEAMASGLPVLTTRCGGPEFFVDEKSGLVVEAGDVEKLADGMAELVRKNEKWDRAAISERAHEQFSARAVGARLVEIYAKILWEKRVL